MTPTPDTSEGTNAADATAPAQLPEWKLYLAQIPGLWAGRDVPVSNIKRTEAATIEDADDQELQHLISLAQRQLDSLNVQLEQIRQRSQFLFSTVLLLVGVSGALLPTVVRDGGVGPFLVWAISVVVLVVSALGTAGVVVNKKAMGLVDAAWVTHQARPWLRASARDHLSSIQTSWETVATQVTLLRDSALLVLLAVLGGVIAWCWAVL